MTINDTSRFTITDSDGNTYNYGTDFTISGKSIIWTQSTTTDDDGNETKTTHGPSSGSTYTLNYSNNTSASISTSVTVNSNGYNVLNFESSNGKYAGSYNSKYLSFEQIPSSEKTVNDSGITIINGDYLDFTFTDSSGNEIEYNGVYGTDFYINSGGTADSNGNTLPVIRWATGDLPTGVKVQVSYKGSQVTETDDGTGDFFNFSMNRTTQDTYLYSTDSSDTPLYSKFTGGTVTITDGSKTFYEGIDFEIKSSGSGSSATAVIDWNPDSSWYTDLTGGSTYTVNLTQADGTTNTYTGIRDLYESLDLTEYGFTSVNGTIQGINKTVDDSIKSYVLSEDGVKESLGVEVVDGGNGEFRFTWQAQQLTERDNMPTYADSDGDPIEYTAEYAYSVNTFTLEDNMNGDILEALGLNYPQTIDEDDEDALAEQAEHYTAAQDAILILDGEEVTRSSNYIGETYNNELIKGMTIQLKGVGTVSLDVAHDAEKAVTSIQSFVDNFNSVISRSEERRVGNTRLSEKQLDADTAATVDSDDFRMRWGLLYGNSVLRQMKTQMRSLVSQNFQFSFTSRSSSEPVYGTMAYNGLRSSSTLRISTGDKYADLTITPEDTLDTILEKLNDKLTMKFYQAHYIIAEYPAVETDEDLFDEYINYLACGLANFINGLHPEIISIGGGIAKQGEKLLKPLREMVNKEIYGGENKNNKTKIVACTLGYKAGLIGAAMAAK